MAGFRLLYHPKVVSRDLPGLDPPIRRRLRTAIERKLMERPEDHAKPLAYTRAGLWSLRVGPWRVVFALRDQELWILKVGHRYEVYKKLEARLPPD